MLSLKERRELVLATLHYSIEYSNRTRNTSTTAREDIVLLLQLSLFLSSVNYIEILTDI